MRMKLLFFGVAAWIAIGVVPAFADVDVLAVITKTKDIQITELINITKVIELDSLTIVETTKAAESQALINQSNFQNHVCENCAEKRDVLTGSVNFNEGITSVNQAAGNMNNQGNAVSVAIDVNSDAAGFAEAQASAQQLNTLNRVNSINILFREALIADSVNFNIGIAHVNQSPGNMNNQANAVSFALSQAPGVALSEADLGQFNTGNVVTENNVLKTAQISGSVVGNTGMVGVNQSSGNMANQANIVAVGMAAKF